MRFRRILIVPALAALAGHGLAHADFVDRISFAQDSLVYVWSEGAPPRAGQAVELAPNKTHAGPIRVVRTGTLEPVTDSGAFDLFGAAPQAFHVASNGPFVIRAELVSGAVAPDQRFSIKLTGIGANAAATDNLVKDRDWSLDQLRTGQIVYRAAGRTARAPGPVDTQSLTFLADWPAQAGATLAFTVETVSAP